MLSANFSDKVKNPLERNNALETSGIIEVGLKLQVNASSSKT